MRVGYDPWFDPSAVLEGTPLVILSHRGIHPLLVIFPRFPGQGIFPTLFRFELLESLPPGNIDLH